MKAMLIAALACGLALPAQAQLAEPNDLGVTFAHVHFNVPDVELHKRIWVEHFGGEVVQKGPLVTVKLPGFFVILTERAPTGPSRGSAMDHFGFKVSDLDPYHEAWRAAGFEVQAEFTGSEGFANSYLVTPDGVRFELQEDPEMTGPPIGYHVHFWSAGPAELRDWYAELFGATPRTRGTLENTADVPGMNLSFARCREECAETRGRAIDHIGFEVEDMQAVAERLAARGIELEFPPRYIESIELEIAFFTDPSGVRVELTKGLDRY